MCDVEIERYAKQMMAKKKYYGIRCRDEETLDDVKMKRYIEDTMPKNYDIRCSDDEVDKCLASVRKLMENVMLHHEEVMKDKVTLEKIEKILDASDVIRRWTRI